ncbi:MAG TPA: hypothetical protein VEB64_00495 [Azospirillaceae bacterium]|nr:hypothetical protein [Azospirillaceae bacterium]
MTQLTKAELKDFRDLMEWRDVVARRLATMEADIRALRRENRTLRKEQAELRAAQDELRLQQDHQRDEIDALRHWMESLEAHLSGGGLSGDGDLDDFDLPHTCH